MNFLERLFLIIIKIHLYGILSITIFISQLFNSFKIYTEKKLFILGSVIITSGFIIIFNFIPMQQINKTIEFQENVYNIINSKELTSKNISKKLGEYVRNEVNNEKNKLNVMDYKWYITNNSSWANIIYNKANSITSSKDLREFVQEIQEFDFDINGQARRIERGKEIHSNRIIVLLTSIIITIGIGVFALKHKENLDEEKELIKEADWY